jgi:hypothetical protein
MGTLRFAHPASGLFPSPSSRQGTSPWQAQDPTPVFSVSPFLFFYLISCAFAPLRLCVRLFSRPLFLGFSGPPGFYSGRATRRKTITCSNPNQRTRLIPETEARELFFNRIVMINRAFLRGTEIFWEQRGQRV